MARLRGVGFEDDLLEYIVDRIEPRGVQILVGDFTVERLQRHILTRGQLEDFIFVKILCVRLLLLEHVHELE